MTPLLYATQNPGKLLHMRTILRGLPVEVLSPQDVGLALPEIDENGSDPLENALLKCESAFAVYGLPVFSCDSGLYIQGLPDAEQPGVHVRRVGEKRLSDEEMIQHYGAIARRLGGRCVVQYRNGIALRLNADTLYTSFDPALGSTSFHLTDMPHARRQEGFPLDCLSVQIASGQYYYDLREDNRGAADRGLTLGFRAFFTEALGL